MKIVRHLKLKEFVWNNLKRLTNNSSKLTVKNLGNGYIKCFWKVSTIDNLRIDFSKSCFFALRLFDISNKRNKENSTCIMKEIQVSKFQSSITFPIPVSKGVYYFEFGFRKKNGQWRKLAHQNLNLGYRIKRVITDLDDNWFGSNKLIGNKDFSIHEKSYQLSLSPLIGGSENVAE